MSHSKSATTERITLPVEMWNLGDHFDYQLPDSRRIAAVEIDAARALPDIERKNNRWSTP